MDCCHAGTINRAFGINFTVPNKGNARFAPKQIIAKSVKAGSLKTFPYQQQATKQKPKARIIAFNASQDNQESSDAFGNIKNGLFTHAFLKAWAKNDNRKSATGLMQAIKRTMPSYQTPRVDRDGATTAAELKTIIPFS